MIYKRFYVSLYIIKLITFKEFMCNRIYGFLISILIFSDFIKYLYIITGGFLNLIIYVYIIMYSANLMYIIYNVNKKKKRNNFMIRLKIKEFLIKNIIYKKGLEYLAILNDIEISQVYESRIKVSLVGIYIKKCLFTMVTINLASIINIIPEQWRYWIYSNKILLNNNKSLCDKIMFISYIDGKIMSKIATLKLCHYLTNLEEYDINYIKYKYLVNYHDTYVQLIYSLTDLLGLFESVLYYKYYKLKKGIKDKYSDNIVKSISINKYEYIYTMYLLILKNILFYIWSFEYYILKDKNKITKLYVIKNVDLEYGYHIYPKDIDNYNTQDVFKVLFSEKELKDFLKKNSINNNTFNFEKGKNINENVYILSHLIELSMDSSLIYINNTNNKKILKDLILFNKNFFKLVQENVLNNNDLSLLKTDMTDAYFVELQNIINELYEE